MLGLKHHDYFIISLEGFYFDSLSNTLSHLSPLMLSRPFEIELICGMLLISSSYHRVTSSRISVSFLSFYCWYFSWSSTNFSMDRGFLLEMLTLGSNVYSARLCLCLGEMQLVLRVEIERSVWSAQLCLLLWRIRGMEDGIRKSLRLYYSLQCILIIISIRIYRMLFCWDLSQNCSKLSFIWIILPCSYLDNSNNKLKSIFDLYARWTWSRSQEYLQTAAVNKYVFVSLAV